VRRVLRVLLWTAGAGVLALATLIGVMWLDHRAETSLPTPTGPLPVGRSIQAWTDEAVDPLAAVAGAKRELIVWIWYPAAAATSGAMDDYLPADLVAATNRQRGALIGRVLTRDLAKVRTHSRRDPELSAQQPSYPILLMRAGASAGVENYSALAEDLASHGYLVVGFNAPYRTGVVTFPDGRVIVRTSENNPELCVGRPDMAQCAQRLLAGWTADLTFVVDRLEQMNSGATPSRFRDRLDLTRVGAFGHSFGGAATALFCAEDARCKAAVNIDGAPHGRVVQEGLRQPFLFILSDHASETDPDSLEILANVQSQYEHLPAGSRHRVAIAGANHFLFSDDGALLKSPVAQGLLRALGMLRIDGRRQLAATSYCLHSFFDAYLKGTTAHPQLVTPLYPEITVID
jgi:dienelactone hydrolase